MNSISKREKILLILLGLVLLFYIYYTFFLRPVMAKTITVKDNVAKCKIQVDKIRNAKVLIEKQKSQLEALKVQLIEILKVMPDSERNPEIVWGILKLGDGSGIQVKTVSIGQSAEFKPQAQGVEVNKDNNPQDKGNSQNAKKESQGEKLFAVPVTIGVSGEYKTIKGFISALEGDKRISFIESTEISKAQDGKIKGNINIIFYYSGGLRNEPQTYDFNEGITYGKEDLFK